MHFNPDEKHPMNNEDAKCHVYIIYFREYNLTAVKN
jgi:hypothetical protein